MLGASLAATVSTSSMSTLTIGLIPRGWSSNADGAGNVEIGNPVFSKTKELTIVFDEDGAGVVADDPKLVVPSIDALCKPKSAAVKKIIELASVRQIRIIARHDRQPRPVLERVGADVALDDLERKAARRGHFAMYGLPMRSRTPHAVGFLTLGRSI